MAIRGFLVWLIVGAASVVAQSNVATTYRAPTTREVREEPALPALQGAGYRFFDPAFSTRLMRLTDASTMPGVPGRSYTTPSAAHQLAWNATSDRFYVRSIDGWFIPYTFDAATMTASRIQPSGTGNGGLLLSSAVADPQFSFLSPNVVYVVQQDSSDPVNRDWPIVRKFDFNTLTYSTIVNLGDLTTVPPQTYATALSSSATAPEKISVIFGGFQDSHYKVAVFNADGTNALVLNTQARTLTANGNTTADVLPQPFNLHHAWIDQSGRYVLLFPAVGWVSVKYYVWDLQTNVISPVNTRPEGHEATGFGVHINQSCCAASSYDAAQWQHRSLASPDSSVDLIAPVLTPQEVYLADHTSWNNARPDIAVPVLSALYRYRNNTSNTTPWRPWDDEIVAIDTRSPGSGATVWRFAHHRSNVAWDGAGLTDVYFWYLPRAVVSPNGRWALFTSNWEKTLGGALGGGEEGGIYRTDVFLVSLRQSGSQPFTDDPLIPRVTPIKAVHITELRARIDARRTALGLGAFAWTDPVLGAGVVAKTAHVSELRTALGQAYVAAGFPSPPFSDIPLVAGVSTIRAAHVQEVREALIDLEPN